MSYGNPEAIDADATDLASASALAEEALALHRDALSILGDGWRGESGCTATDLLRRQCADAADLVAALHAAAAEFRSLRDVIEGAVIEGTAMEGDALGRVGPVPDDARQNYAQSSARLSDRPQPHFETPAPQPAYAPSSAAAPPAMSWPSGGLPDVGGALAGLVAQIADVLIPDSAIPDAAIPSEPIPSEPIPEGTDTPAAADPPVEALPRQNAVATAADESGPELPPPLPLLPPSSPPVSPAPVSAPAPEPEPEAEPEPPQPQPSPQPEPPPLAAERPPEPEPAAPELPADPRTPCEIAADELPQVGE